MKHTKCFILPRIITLAFLILVIGGWTNQVDAQLVFPKPVGFVNDFANIIDDTTEASIAELLGQVKDASGAEVSVVTVQSLEGNEPNYFAVELGRAWGVGNKERDDGVVFLTAVDDREVYIATGYGIEGFITDAQAFYITQQVVVPYFKQGDFAGGILAGVQKIKAALVDLEKLPEGGVKDSGTSLGTWIFYIFFAFSFVLPWISAVLGRSKAWWPGGVVGGVAGAGISFMFGVSLLFIVPLIIFGLLIDYLASSNYKKGKKSFWTGGGGSGWGGGSGGWGGGSSGGFGGFSGGSFGGGGGGSSW